MIQNKSKNRLFEVMSRLDKTFKPKLNENFEEIEAEVPAGLGGEANAEIGGEEPVELSPEEKLAQITTKLAEIQALLDGGAEPEVDGAEEIAVTTGEVDTENPENLQEWNFDKKKGEDKKDDKSEDDDDDKKEDVDESEEKKQKIPVAAVAKVGK